ncbi:MAG TPA: hypothetical protein ENJ19_06295 [Gammaproteobacteria bacterium]|nr:hypothetical protein [Gammaproteobacteria bacterium]
MTERKKQAARGKEKTAAAAQPPAAVSAPLNPQLRRSEPAVVQLGQDALAHFVGDWSEKRVKAVLADVAGRKRPLESVLLDLAASARSAVQKAVDDTRERSVAEQRLDKQYREQLLTQGRKKKRTRARKGEIRVQGQLVHPRTGEPVAGMVVEAIDKDVRKHDLLGAAVSDAQGRFEIAFRPKDYKESGEKTPEIMLSVGADRKQKLYIADRPLEFKGEQPEAVTITLPDTRVEAVNAFCASRQRLSAKRRARASEELLRRNVEREALTAAADTALTLLNDGIGFLEARRKKKK